MLRGGFKRMTAHSCAVLTQWNFSLLGEANFHSEQALPARMHS
jgi:hypothetical protein